MGECFFSGGLQAMDVGFFHGGPQTTSNDVFNGGQQVMGEGFFAGSHGWWFLPCSPSGGGGFVQECFQGTKTCT